MHIAFGSLCQCFRKVAIVWPELQLRHRSDYSFHKFDKRVGCPRHEKVYTARDVFEEIINRDVFPECECLGFSLIALTTHVS